MSDVFRIVERFQITGHGTVYLLTMNKDAKLHVGDLFWDLRGNRFKVTGIEMIRRRIDDIGNAPTGVMFKLLDGVEVEGNILVKDIYDVNFLFCNHPLYPRRVDEDYEEEYQAAGLHHECALFSYEDMENGKLSLFGESIQGLTIYRGWMMKPEMYRAFYQALENKGIVLINSPEEYERYHLLPEWYPDFKEITVESVWTGDTNLDGIIKMTKDLSGAYIVKDFVKSRKHEWYDACFISDISNNGNARKIISNFINRQGDSLVGGIVLRKFIELNPIGFHGQSGMPISEEYRIFVYAGKVLCVDDYWDSNQKGRLSDEEYLWIEEICKRIRSNYVSLDLARTVDGNLIVMELGDGQVSGLQQIEANRFYEKFPYSIPVEEIIPEDAVIIATEPLLNVSVEEAERIISNLSSIQQIVDIYAEVHNKFWFIEDEIFDYVEGTYEYLVAKENAESWQILLDKLEENIVEAAKGEKLFVENQDNIGIIKRLVPFMNKYGYKDGHGWWVKV